MNLPSFSANANCAPENRVTTPMAAFAAGPFSGAAKTAIFRPDSWSGLLSASRSSFDVPALASMDFSAADLPVAAT